MTDEEIGKIWDANVPILNTENVLAFTRAIETKTRGECIATLRDMHQELFTMGTKVIMATGRGDTMLDGQAYGLKLAIEALEKSCTNTPS